MTTFAPCSAIAAAMARPMPRDEPVTIATLPVRSNSRGQVMTDPFPGEGRGPGGAAGNNRPLKPCGLLGPGLRRGTSWCSCQRLRMFGELDQRDAPVVDLVRTVGEA